jgi:hypothetical protein
LNRGRHSFLDILMKISVPRPDKSLFLCFLNRELHYLHNRDYTLQNLKSFVKLSSLMTSGVLYAPFGQMHELAQRDLSFITFVEKLTEAGKLRLINGDQDFNVFIERRRQLYSTKKNNFQNYFAKKPLLASLYKNSPKINTTLHIKKELGSGLII